MNLTEPPRNKEPSNNTVQRSKPPVEKKRKKNNNNNNNNNNYMGSSIPELEDSSSSSSSSYISSSSSSSSEREHFNGSQKSKNITKKNKKERQGGTDVPGARKDMEAPYLEADLLTPVARCSGGPTTLTERPGGDLKSVPTGDPRGISEMNLLKNNNINKQKMNKTEEPPQKHTYNIQTLLKHRIHTQNKNETKLINTQNRNTLIKFAREHIATNTKHKTTYQQLLINISTNHGAKAKYKEFQNISTSTRKNKKERQGGTDVPGAWKDMEAPYLETDLLTPVARCSGGPTTLTESPGGDSKDVPSGDPRGISEMNLLKKITPAHTQPTTQPKHTQQATTTTQTPTPQPTTTETPPTPQQAPTTNTTPPTPTQDIEIIIEILKDINKIHNEDNEKPTEEKQKNKQDERRDQSKHAFTGMAGQPREKSQRRPKEPSPKRRNNKRGIRGKTKTDERKEKRTEKRRNARQKQRDNKQAKGTNLFRTKKERAATAQQPQNKIKFGKTRIAKIMLGTTFKIATLNTKGIKRQGAREEIEEWMKENDIKILAIQETRINTNSKEARGAYTWYMSGEGGKTKDQKYTAGVGFVIDNKFVKYIEDVIPHTERFIQLKLKGTCNINLINVYMPPAISLVIKTEEDKEKIYKKLEEITNKAKGKGPTYILGDWNARMQKHQNKEEFQVFGKWTLEPEKTNVHELSEEVQWNRNRCIQFCQKHKLILSNTKFQKTKQKNSNIQTTWNTHWRRN